jgi:hypothetical protein
MTRKYLTLRKLRKKRKKNVDRRASKGRKIKYIIHEKLVNFMAPQPNRYPLAYTETANQLFSSLFGQKPSQNIKSEKPHQTNNEKMSESILLAISSSSTQSQTANSTSLSNSEFLPTPQAKEDQLTQ